VEHEVARPAEHVQIRLLLKRDIMVASTFVLGANDPTIIIRHYLDDSDQSGLLGILYCAEMCLS
jgi:hypothetical protein